jgi:hypothetical protein
MDRVGPANGFGMDVDSGEMERCRWTWRSSTGGRYGADTGTNCDKEEAVAVELDAKRLTTFILLNIAI